MTDPREVEVASVWKKDRLAGELRRTPAGVTFSYHTAYLAAGGHAVAVSLPLSTRELVAPAGAVPPFFAGLLPEGARLTALTTRLKTSADDELSLLLAVGGDTVGDVRVAAAGEAPVEPEPLVRVERWEDVDLERVLATSVGLDPDDFERSALPGVQEKVSAQMVSFPLRRHFVKLSPPGLPRLVENEAFFLAMAADCGLRVPIFELVHDLAGRSALLVERFDRHASPAGQSRLAQEDGCQLLGRYPADKYRVRYLEVARAVLAATDFPTLDAQQLVQVCAFSYLIGNGDLHAKNVSIGELETGEVRMTPNYDLLSTLAYIGNDPLALEVEGKRSNLRRDHLLALAAQVGVGARAVQRDLDRMCELAGPWAERVAEIGLDERRTSRLARELLARRDHLGRERGTRA